MRDKLFTIAWKDIYTTFQDRNAMLYMFAMPIALSLIIALAFGTSGDVELDQVPVAVINQDQGAALPGGETMNLGKTLQDAFVPTGDTALDAAYATIHDLVDGTLYQDVDKARQEVEDGDLAALINIPDAAFSQNALTGPEPGVVDVYYDSGRAVSPSIVRSIVNSITNGMNTVMLARRVGPACLTQLGSDLGQDQAAIEQAADQINVEAMSIAQSAPIQLEKVDLAGETRTFDALQYFAPSMAILFMTFTMAMGGSSILTESQRWTLQRIITTPTPRWVFMAGKLLGTYTTGVIQMILLIVSTILLARMMGREVAVWGHNVPGLALLVLAVVFAGTSLGLVIAALSKTPEQASSYSSIALFLLGMLGGSFISIENLPGWLPRLTLNYWGIDGFTSLSTENAAISEIGVDLLALVVIGVVLFAISLWRFNRRLDI